MQQAPVSSTASAKRRLGRKLLGTAMALGAVAALGTGCQGASLNEIAAGKACGPAAECLTGYMCDTSRNVCVTEGAVGGHGAGGDGGSGGCESLEDCPVPLRPCTSRQCLGGRCGIQAVPAGGAVPEAEQTQGDCLLSVCDGQGNVVDDYDDTDEPADGNDCTDDLCDSGQPSNPPMPLRTACSSDEGSLCDGQGHCVACSVPSDCWALPPDDECRQRSCQSGACVQIFTAQGNPLGLQAPSDCLAVVCDGHGSTEPVPDDLDLPADGLECTADACNDGACSNVAKPSTEPCGHAPSMHCDGAGQCIGCEHGSDCGPSDFCHSLSCNPSHECVVQNTSEGTPLPASQQTEHDCRVAQCDGHGNLANAADDLDLPADDGNPCTEQACSNGVARHPPSPAGWPCDPHGHKACDGAGGCVEKDRPS